LAKSVSQQMIDWIEKNRRKLDNLNVGTFTFFVHNYLVRRVRFGEDACTPEETVEPIVSLEIPPSH
jgi:hypothetical protein